MERRDFVLAAMSPAGNRPFSPVQVQKLFFLLDRNVSEQTGGPHFAFQPYDYGPFDKEVYLELERLEDDGLVEILEPHWLGSRTYRLTDEGQGNGDEAFRGLSRGVQRYIREVVAFVRSQSFVQLVSAIYQAYPEMRANSVFVQGVV